MTQRVTVGNRASINIKQLSAEEVAQNIHHLIQWIYANLFTWLVRKINFSQANTVVTRSKPSSFIGILDMCGFENLHNNNNSLHQLCVNLACERLHQQFNACIFDLEQEQYRGEFN